MSLKCPTSPVYRTSVEQKLKGKNAAKVLRHGTPKLRDLLREKCRIRIHEARRLCIDQYRNIKDLNLEEILRQELAELEKDIEIQEEIYKEIIEEFNEWFIQQLELEESYLIDMELNDAIICPVCQKLNLKIETSSGSLKTFKCECNTKFNYDNAKDNLKNILQAKINEHEKSCVEVLNFFVEPNSNGSSSLNSICNTCDFFYSF